VANIRIAKTRRIDPATGNPVETLDEYKRRMAAVHPTGGPYNPADYDESTAGMFLDSLRAVPPALLNVGESALGQIGDVTDWRNQLAALIADYGYRHGSSFDQRGNVAQLDRFRPRTTEEIESFSNSLMSPQAMETLRYQPHTPFGKALQTGLEWTVDPTALGVPAGKLMRLF
jgi:hypothetical protein